MGLKLSLLLSFILMVSCGSVFSQDVIYTMEGEKLKTEVQVIGTKKITYKLVSDSADVKRQILLSQVYMIRYENGKEEILTGQIETADSANPKQGTIPDSNNKAIKAKTEEGKPLKMLSPAEKCERG